jgi:hypothetical protein
MKINRCYWLLAALLSCLGIFWQTVLAAPVAWEQPQQAWLSQQSQHFTISFLDGHQRNAARALDIAEHVHNELLPFFKKEPQQRTEMVLVDDYDVSNGWASVFPFAQIRLIMSPPDDVTSLEVNDEWLHTLIRHEYVHIMHMELAGGAVAALRHIFGRNFFLFPHALTPSVLLEGLAVYLESNKELGYGRLQSASYEMQMRMQVAGGELKDLQQVAVASREWPFASPYLYGAYFIEYLVDTYGEQKLQQFLQQYSRQLLPYFLLNHYAEKAFGKDFLTLWRDYQIYLTERFSGAITALKQQAVIGNDLGHHLFQQVTTTGDNGLLLNQNNGEDRAELALLNVEQNKMVNWQKIVASKGVTALDYHPDGGVVVSRRINYIDGHIFNDLFLYKNGKWTQLSKRKRFSRARWMPDGKQLLASRKVDGLSELWLLTLQPDRPAERLWQGEAEMVLGGFDISADGNYLVASLKRPHQGWNLERLPLNCSTENYLHWQSLTNSKAVENNPVFLPDGRIAFSADYQGIYNIYVLDQRSQLVSQWTREIGGAFQPQWQPGLGLVYQAYDIDGYTLRNIEQPESLFIFPVEHYQGQYNYPEPVITTAVKLTPQAYSPWSTLRPRSWFPYWEFDELVNRAGISSYGADALARHNYQIAVDWDFKNNFGNYDLNYQYDNRWYVNALRTHSFYEVGQGGLQDHYINEDDLLRVQRRNLFPLWEDQLRFHVGLVWDKARFVYQPDFINTTQYQTTDETLAGVALTFDNREWYLNVPGTGWGNYFDFVVETNTPLNSDYSGQKYQGQWSGTFDLPGRNTLTARLGFGYADSDAKRFVLGGHDLTEEAFLFARDSQALRGYDESVQRGHRYATQRLQMNAWLGRVERNWGLLPVGLGDFSCAFFIDSGAVWDAGEEREQLTGIGSELTLEVKLGYDLTLPVTFGLAKGLDNEVGTSQAYLQMQLDF